MYGFYYINALYSASLIRKACKFVSYSSKREEKISLVSLFFCVFIPYFFEVILSKNVKNGELMMSFLMSSGGIEVNDFF